MTNRSVALLYLIVNCCSGGLNSSTFSGQNTPKKRLRPCTITTCHALGSHRFWGHWMPLGHMVLQSFVHVRSHFQPSILTKFVFEHFDHCSFVYCYMICIANKQTISTVHATGTRLYIYFQLGSKKTPKRHGDFLSFTLLRLDFASRYLHSTEQQCWDHACHERPLRLALVRRGSLFNCTFYRHPG